MLQAKGDSSITAGHPQDPQINREKIYNLDQAYNNSCNKGIEILKKHFCI